MVAILPPKLVSGIIEPLHPEPLGIDYSESDIMSNRVSQGLISENTLPE